jgi:hypothetical protein
MHSRAIQCLPTKRPGVTACFLVVSGNARGETYAEPLSRTIFKCTVALEPDKGQLFNLLILLV